MSKTTTLYLTRHGETEWNVEGKLQGHKDSPLTKLGRRQAQWLGASLKDIEFDAIYSSLSPRANLTAEIIKDNRKIHVSSCETLMEIHMGSWEGKKRSEIERDFLDEYHLFWSAPHLYIPKNGGETFFELQDRLIPQVKEIISRHHGGNVLIVTHAIALKVIMAYFKGDSLKELWSPPEIQPTALNKVVIAEDRIDIERYGDVSHYQTVRKAVGAIAYQGNRFLLVHKVTNTFKEPPGVWDFPKGGVEEEDLSLEAAVMRELLEETGTDKYIVKQELPGKISLNFNGEIRKRIGYERQETTMFLVEFLGNLSDLKPTDKEIDEIMLVEAESLMKKLSHEETAQYVKKYFQFLLSGRTAWWK